MVTMFVVFFYSITVCWKFLIKKNRSFEKKKILKNLFLNTKEKQIVGLYAKVIEPSDDNKISRIKFLDSSWRAKSQCKLKSGEVVKIYKVIGNTLHVKKLLYRSERKIFKN